MHQLSNEEKMKVFAMYYGQEFVFEDNEPDEVCGIYGNSVIYSQDADESGEGMFSVDECKLLLTPLEKITDEHALQIARMEKNNGCTLEEANSIKKYILDFKYYLTFPSFIYLINNGYDMPMYFAPGHWANSKTALELNLAIEKR